MAIYTPLGVRLTDYIPHYPEPPQEAFLSLDCLEALYGGAAGGGKSDALLMAALQYVDIPNYTALLLRRTYPELSMPGGLMHRSKLWLSDTDASWTGSSGDESYTWRFPSGARLVFGHGETEKAILRYYGSEWDFIGWDELTHFPEEWYRLLFSRVRQLSDSQIPPRVRSGTNPGGPGHRWVKRRLVDRLPDPDDPEDSYERCAKRVFIPAKLGDNPHIDQEGYRDSLRELDSQTRAQLEEGDWEARGPGKWAFDHHGIAAAKKLGEQLDAAYETGDLPPPVNHEVYLGVDWGDFATHGLLIWPLERGGIYVPREVAMSRVSVEQITKALLKMAGAYPYWLAQERYDSSFAQSNRTFKEVAEQELGRHNKIKRSGRPDTYKVNFNQSKLLAIRYIRLLLERTLKGETTRVLAISPRCEVLLNQLESYEEDELDRFAKGDDDSIDALIAGVTPPARKNRKNVEAEIEEAKNRAEALDRERRLHPHTIGGASA